jgi:hypothetical protein
MTSPDRRYSVAYASETEIWQAADGTGRQVTTQLGPQYPDQASAAYWAKMLPSAKPGADDLTLGDPPLPPLPTDQARLAELLKIRYGGGAAAKETSTLYARYAVPRAVRAEILRVLAGVPGLLWRGEVTDRAGRQGVAVTYDDGEHGQQSLLVFDPRTGELLAHELLTMSQPVKMDAYQVILETSWTDRPGQ